MFISPQRPGKIFPLTWPWKFLTFPETEWGSYLQRFWVWRVPESLGWPKKCKKSKFDQITWLFILMSILKENLKSKPKNFRLEKGLFFGVTLIQAVKKSTTSLSRAEINEEVEKVPPPHVFSFGKRPRSLRVREVAKKFIFFNLQITEVFYRRKGRGGGLGS